jgi:hypothetical protein
MSLRSAPQYLAHPGQSLQEHVKGTALSASRKIRQAGCTDFTTITLTEDGGLTHDVGKATEPFNAGMHAIEQGHTGGTLPWAIHAPYSAYALVYQLVQDRRITTEKGVSAYLDLLYLLYHHHSGFSENYGDVCIKMKAAARWALGGPLPEHWSLDAPKVLPTRNTYGLDVVGPHHVTDRYKVIYVPYLLEAVAFLRTLHVSPRAQGPSIKKGQTERFRSYTHTRMAMAAIGYGDIVDTAGLRRSEPYRLQPEYVKTRVLAHREGLRAAASQSDAKVVALRDALFDRCLSYQDTGSQFLLLTAPTGGAKTLASVALATAIGGTQIIYCLPYLSIVGQVTEMFQQLALIPPQDKHTAYGVNVLEHVSVPSSEFQTDKATNARGLERPKSQREIEREAFQSQELSPLLEWSHPVIVTSIERLSRVLCGRKRMDALRMMALTSRETVVLVDECQSIPSSKLYAYLRIFENLGARVILLSATTGNTRNTLRDGGFSFSEVVPPGALPGLQPRRHYSWTKLSDGPDLPQHAQGQVISIYSTKRWARAAFETVRHIPHAYLLDTNICSGHRITLLAEIRQRLREGLPVILAATPTVEAGVNLDFPVGYRMFAPVTSVMQAGGRVNREGRLTLGHLTVWWPSVVDNKTPFVQAASPELYKQAVALKDAAEKGVPLLTDEDLVKHEEAVAVKLSSTDQTNIGKVFLHHKHVVSSLDEFHPDTDYITRESGLDSIEGFQLIPRDDLVQVLVDFNGTVALALNGCLTRAQYNLRTIESRPPEWWKAQAARGKVPQVLVREQTIVFKGETDPSKIFVHEGQYDPRTGIDMT